MHGLCGELWSRRRMGGACSTHERVGRFLHHAPSQMRLLAVVPHVAFAWPLGKSVQGLSDKLKAHASHCQTRC